MRLNLIDDMGRFVKTVTFACALGVTLLAPNAMAKESQYANALSSDDYLDNEPPAVRTLFLDANNLLASQRLEDGAWQAADKFCQASRYGSAEGLYRLGLLYMLGWGVPESREYAASLFGTAAAHGHFEAQKMLETVELTSQTLPPCVMADVAPEHPLDAMNENYHSPAIEAYVDTLPKSKKWVVNLAEKIADWHHVDSALVLSIISAESNFKTTAASNRDAKGLMQLIPATAQRFNVKNVFNVSQNIKGGVKYLRWLLSYFRGDVTLAVAAYNAGEHTVDRYKGVPPFSETKNYVQKVMALYGNKKHPFDPNLASQSPAVNLKKSK